MTPAAKKRVSKRAPAKKTPPVRTPRKKPEAFPVVTEEVPYGVDQTKRPLLYEVLAPLAMEADDHDGQTPWRATKGHSISQIRSAAAAWGYRVNVSTSVSGEQVFRLNGKLPLIVTRSEVREMIGEAS